MRVVLQTMLHGAQYNWAHQQFSEMAIGCAETQILTLQPQALRTSRWSVFQKYSHRRKLFALFKNALMRPFFKKYAAEFSRKTEIIDAAMKKQTKISAVPYQICVDEAEARALIEEFDADTVIVIGSPFLSKKYFIDGIRYINLHIGKIPDYRGLKCIEWAILNGDFHAIGYTVHEMTPVLDLGRIFEFETIDYKEKTLSQIYIDCYQAGIMRCIELGLSENLEGEIPSHKGNLYQSIDFSNLEMRRVLGKAPI